MNPIVIKESAKMWILAKQKKRVFDSDPSIRISLKKRIFPVLPRRKRTREKREKERERERERVLALCALVRVFILS